MHPPVNRKCSFGPLDDPFVSEALDNFFNIRRPKKTVFEHEIKRQKLLDLQADIDQRLDLDLCPPRPPCHSRRQSLSATMCRFTAVTTPSSNPSNDLDGKSHDAKPVVSSPVNPKAEVLAQPRTGKHRPPNEKQRKRRQAKKKAKKRKGEPQQAASPLSPPPPYSSLPPGNVEAGKTPRDQIVANSSCISSPSSSQSSTTLPPMNTPDLSSPLAMDTPNISSPPPVSLSDSAGPSQPTRFGISRSCTATQGSKAIHPPQRSTLRCPSCPDETISMTHETATNMASHALHFSEHEVHPTVSAASNIVHRRPYTKTPADVLFAESDDLLPPGEQQQQQLDEEEDSNLRTFVRKVHEEQIKLQRCEQRSHKLCIFEPNCGVHVPKSMDCVCPPRKSCCCAHFKAHCQYDSSDAAPKSITATLPPSENVAENVQSEASPAERQESGDIGEDTG